MMYECILSNSRSNSISNSNILKNEFDQISIKLKKLISHTYNYKLDLTYATKMRAMSAGLRIANFRKIQILRELAR